MYFSDIDMKTNAISVRVVSWRNSFYTRISIVANMLFYHESHVFFFDKFI